MALIIKLRARRRPVQDNIVPGSVLGVAHHSAVATLLWQIAQQPPKILTRVYGFNKIIVLIGLKSIEINYNENLQHLLFRSVY
jgi:hypothetical protein